MTATAGQGPQFIKANGLDLCYEIFGADNAEPLVLIMGLAAQMTHWDDEFCAQLADASFRVIRFDNRDIGLSSKISGFEPVGAQAVIQGALAGKPVPPPYLLRDMADDVTLAPRTPETSAPTAAPETSAMVPRTPPNELDPGESA